MITENRKFTAAAYNPGNTSNAVTVDTAKPEDEEIEEDEYEDEEDEYEDEDEVAGDEKFKEKLDTEFPLSGGETDEDL